MHLSFPTKQRCDAFTGFNDDDPARFSAALHAIMDQQENNTPDLEAIQTINITPLGCLSTAIGMVAPGYFLVAWYVDTEDTEGNDLLQRINVAAYRLLTRLIDETPTALKVYDHKDGAGHLVDGLDHHACASLLLELSGVLDNAIEDTLARTEATPDSDWPQN
jgi:hypothetical protein